MGAVLLVSIGKALVAKGSKIIGDIASKSLYLLDDIGGPFGLIFGFASSLVVEYTPLGDKLKDGADWVLDEAMPTVQRVFNKFPKIGR